MAGLNFVGIETSTDKHVMRKRAIDDLLDTGTTRTYALDRITTLSAPYATTTYVDAADNTFTVPATVDTADALNLPLTAKAVANGVATLDSGSKVLLAQCPNLGVGFLKGPYGVTTQVAADTSTTTHVPIATIDLGSSGTGITFKPMAYATAMVQQVANSRAVLELRIGTDVQSVAVGTTGSTADTAYAAQTLIAMSYGRSFYNDYQPIALGPSGDTTGTTFSAGRSASTHWVITLWLVSADAVGTVTVRNANITTMAAYLLRTAL